MTTPVRAPHTSPASHTSKPLPDFAALMRHAAESGRTGTEAALVSQGRAPDVATCVRAIERLLDTRRQLAGRPALNTINAGIVRSAQTTLAQATDGPARAALYASFIDMLDRDTEAWGLLAPEQVVATHVHDALVWYTAWHMADAGQSADQILKILGEPEPEPATPPASATPSAPIQEVPGLLDAAQSAIRKTFEDAGTMWVQLFRYNPTPTNPQPSELPASPRTLNGKALRTTVIGTWFMLVAMSWVSLFWGMFISMPTGIGLGVMLSAPVAIFAVPLWATAFGFLGMGFARDATLKQMEFKELPEDHPLRLTATRFCQQLEIPVPKLGTIDAHNAFAMGTSQDKATVALGRPLIETLTPQETSAVLAHELGHVVSGDMRKMMLMRTFQNATVWFAMAQGVKQFARWIICWAAELYILAFSRRREYWADAIGAALAGKEAMIGALEKLDKAPALSRPEQTHARFMFRGKPLSTHPATADRIQALREETFIRRLPS